VRSAFDAPAARRYERHVAARARRVAALVGTPIPGSVLDVGCGDGEIGLQFATPPTSVVLIDLSEAMVAKARVRAQARGPSDVSILCGDFMVELRGERFDLVLGIGLLAHGTSVAAAVSRMADLVGPGGRAVLQITDAATMLGRVERLMARTGERRRGYRLNRTTTRKIVQLMQAKGLELAASQRYQASYLRRRASNANDLAAAKWFDRFGGERLLVFRRPS
jgi:2-polyprenyl-3-methyl-5-hydroxy-6-metoxy-1,4-benzoquinol methylase